MLVRCFAQVPHAEALAAVATSFDVQLNRCSADRAVISAPAPMRTDAINVTTPGPEPPNDVTELNN